MQLTVVAHFAFSSAPLRIPTLPFRPSCLGLAHKCSYVSFSPSLTPTPLSLCPAGIDEFYALVQQDRLAMGGDAQRRFGKDSIRRGGMRAVMKKEANGRL